MPSMGEQGVDQRAAHTLTGLPSAYTRTGRSPPELLLGPGWSSTACCGGCVCSRLDRFLPLPLPLGAALTMLAAWVQLHSGGFTTDPLKRGVQNSFQSLAALVHSLDFAEFKAGAASQQHAAPAERSTRPLQRLHRRVHAAAAAGSATIKVPQHDISNALVCD